MVRKLQQPGFGLAIVMALIFLGLQMALGVPFAVIDALYGRVLHQPSPQLAFSPVVMGLVNILAAGGAVAFGLFLNRMPLRGAMPSPRITFGQVFAVALISLGGAVVLSELDNLTRWVLPPPRFFQEWLSELMFGGSLPGQIFLLVIVAPVTEELMFRGIVLRGLLSWYRPWVAVILSAALFGAVHMNPWQFLPATFLGIAFGWFYLRTGSVPLTMIGHACFNGLALMAARAAVDVPGLTGNPAVAGMQFQPWWIDVAGAAILLAGIFLFAKTAPGVSAEPATAPPVIPFASAPSGASDAPPRLDSVSGEQSVPGIPSWEI